MKYLASIFLSYPSYLRKKSGRYGAIFVLALNPDSLITGDQMAIRQNPSAGVVSEESCY
jgi:hypothetical protein